MAYIFARNKCKNELKKTRIGLEIYILENNENYNYVNDIFYTSIEKTKEDIKLKNK